MPVMKRTSSQALFEGPERRVTRAQIHFIKSIFPFLHLPAELREIVYFYCFSFKGIETFFDGLCTYVRKHADSRTGMTQVCGRHTPSVLFINRQIFNEAVTMIRKHSATFHHGLLNTKLYRVIQENPLRQLASIDITDKGHPLLEKPILATSWHGYMRLLRGLADVLEKGHHLKNFTVNFTDPRLKEHVTSCAHGDWDCGFRDQLRDACNSLRKVRGITNVNFYGIEASQAAELKYRMQSTTITTFFSLPRDIRDTIYDLSTDWSDSSKALTKSLTQWEGNSEDYPYPELSTPTVLQINKQINREARKVLHAKPLDLVFPKETTFCYEWHLPRLLSFISRKTMRNIQTVNITIEHWKWAWTLIHPLEYLVRRVNCFKKITITVKDARKEATIFYPRGNGQSIAFHRDFKHLPAMRGNNYFGVRGDVPDFFIGPLAHILVYSTTMKQANGELPAVGTQLGQLVHGYEPEHQFKQAQSDAEIDRELAERVASW